MGEGGNGVGARVAVAGGGVAEGVRVCAETTRVPAGEGGTAPGEKTWLHAAARNSAPTHASFRNLCVMPRPFRL